jgi:ABC-type sugar transport system ATPase subunit
VTHDQTEAMTLADRIVVLNGGRVEQIGAPLELFNDPASRFVAGFIGSPRMNLLEARAKAGNRGHAGLMLAGGTILRIEGVVDGLDTDAQVAVGFRPQQGLLSGDGLPLKVMHVEQLGSETIFHCRTLADENVVIGQYGQVAIGPGETIHLDTERTPFLLFDAAGARIRAHCDPP